MKHIFQRLVRFQDTSGCIFYGEAPTTGELVGQEVPVYAGDNPWDLEVTSTHAKISTVSHEIWQKQDQ